MAIIIKVNYLLISLLPLAPLYLVAGCNTQKDGVAEDHKDKKENGKIHSRPEGDGLLDSDDLLKVNENNQKAAPFLQPFCGGMTHDELTETQRKQLKIVSDQLADDGEKDKLKAGYSPKDGGL